MMMKKIYLFTLIFFFPFFCFAQDVQSLEQSLEAKYGVDVLWNVKVTDIWQSVTYSDVHSASLMNYLQLLDKEMNKYSKAYFEAIDLEMIVLGKNLTFSGQARSAVPDPYKGALYYSVNGAYGDSSYTYLTHSFHHELHHYTEYSIWGTMTYDWPDWQVLNIDGFQYGSGGASGYSDQYTDYYSPVHPEDGFLNLYSMTGDEEDRCEIIAFYLTDSEKEKTKELLQSDELLMKKYKLLANFVNKISGDIILPLAP